MTDTIFSPAFGNKPGTLVGRDSEMNKLTNGLSARPGSKERALLILGQRGLGKTVLLLELAEYARSHQYIVASPTVVSDDMLDRILEKLRRDGEKHLHDEKRKVTGGSFSILGFGAGIQTETTPEVRRSFASQLLDLCEEAANAGKGILILVDEVQANSEALKKLIIAYQEMVGEGQNIAIVFAGLPAAVSKALNEHVLTFFNRASKLELKPISKAEIVLYYSQCFNTLGLKISDKQIERAAAATEGSPYMMQLVGHYIMLIGSDKELLSDVKLDRALVQARKEFINDICETTLASLSERDIDFLRAMSQDAQYSTLKDISLRMNAEPSYTQKYKTRLSQAGIITQPRRGVVQYAVPYLREFFQSET